MSSSISSDHDEGDSDTNDVSIRAKLLQKFIQRMNMSSSISEDSEEDSIVFYDSSSLIISDEDHDEEDSDTNDDQIGHRRKIKSIRISDSDSDESDEEDHQLEDEDFSKATLRSIHGFLPCKSIPFRAENSDDDSDVNIAEFEESLLDEAAGGVSQISQAQNNEAVLAKIQQQIDERPMETTVAKPLRNLKVKLMPHQLHAIEFMTWRERSRPRGGILADDMGLGKTLTTISLIMKSIQATKKRKKDGEDSSSGEDDDEDDGWKALAQKALKPALKPGGTLIVCPPSLLLQWEDEIESKVKDRVLTSYRFYGGDREHKPRKLARHDIVITTYQIAVNEEKKNGCLFQVKWKRIVLDEFQIIDSHNSNQSEAVCKLESKYRWVLSGTPIQNEKFDLFAAVKFLKCRPFDELRFWEQWVEVKGQEVSPHVQALLKSIMLRRTKQQLIESGKIGCLPNKVFQQFEVTLTQDERSVYDKFMCFSQALFANFMLQQQDENDNFTYEKQKVEQLFKKFAQKHNIKHKVQAHEVLTTILRLRQICCHPGLTKNCTLNSIENFDVEGGEDLDDANISDENRTLTHQYSPEADVFKLEMPTSKLKLMMEVLRKHVLESSDKCLIVSQWTGYLNVIRKMLEKEKIWFYEFNSKDTIDNRNDIVNNFNTPRVRKKVMLLSLTASGVRLNLFGATYLFLMDAHWNPELEQKAQSLIYNCGQKKQINVLRFICKDTIEEQILELQQKKMDAANSALTRGKKVAGSELTMDEIKTLLKMEE